MRDASKDIRVFSALALSNINVTDDLGNAYNVPVYDGKAPTGAPFPRIILGGISSPSGNVRFSKCAFGGVWSQTIKASMFYQGDVTKNLVDDISNEISVLLCPLLPPYISLSPDFNVFKVDVVMGPHLEYTDEIGNYIDKNITINYSITQN